MSKFTKDAEEYNLIDKYPTKTQFKYGRIDHKEITGIKYKRVSLDEHLSRIHSIYLKTNEVKTTIPKPKRVNKADKTKVRTIV